MKNTRRKHILHLHRQLYKHTENVLREGLWPSFPSICKSLLNPQRAESGDEEATFTSNAVSECVCVCRSACTCVHILEDARGQPWVSFFQVLSTLFFNTRSPSFTWNLPVWQTDRSVSSRAHPALDSPILGLPTFTAIHSSSVSSGVRCRPSYLRHHKHLPRQAVLPARTFLCNGMFWWAWNSHLLVLEELLENDTSKHFSPENHSVNKKVADPFLQ